MTDEDKCLKCGKCCRYVIPTSRRFVETGVKCLYLTRNNLCSIYDHRPKGCHTIEDIKQMGKIDSLPDGCGYRRE